MEGNRLSGGIPSELCHLADLLTELYLDGNQLTGQGAVSDYMEEHHPDCDVSM